jgi:membrane fusion protein, heavy metal efflux system
MKNKIVIFICVILFAGVLVSLPFAYQNDGHDHPENEHDEIGQNNARFIDEEEGEYLGHDDHENEHVVNDSHDDHEGESVEDDDHEEGELVLTDEQKHAIGIKVETASSGKLHSELTLTGELMLNEDAIAHIIPRVNGVAIAVNYTSGEKVKKGDVLAVLESAELGESFAEYMVSRKTYERKRKLYEEKIASQNDYLEVLNRFEQVTADLYIKLGKEKYLQASEMYEERYTPKTNGQVKALPITKSIDFVERTTRYEISAPIDGTIIKKHITRGEKVGDDVNVFTVADLNTVWVNLQVSTRDISLIHQGMNVVVESSDSLKTEGEVTMISPVVDAETRTATARVVVDNNQGDWMPGAFVIGSIRISDKNLPLVIPRYAVQNFEGKDIVFLADEHGYRQVPVVSGRHDRNNVEILSGIKAGQQIVTQGAFELKAILLTSGMDSHAGHGH